MTYAHALANYCGECWNALVDQPNSGNRDFFCRKMRDGYLSWSMGNNTAHTFRRSLGNSQWGQLDTAARLFANRVPISNTNNLYLGTRDFLGLGWRHSDLDNRLANLRLNGNPLIPSLSQGFTDSEAAKRRVLPAITSWRTLALGIVNHPDFNRLYQTNWLTGLLRGSSWRNHYITQVRAAATLYVAALGSPSNLLADVRQPYYSYLTRNPAKIWPAYLVALYPAMRQMGTSITYSVIRSFDPYRGSPPTSASRALVNSALQGLSFGLWNP